MVCGSATVWPCSYKNTAHLGVDWTEILLLLTSLIFIIYYAKWTWVRKLSVLLYYCEIISRGFYIYFIDIATLLSSGRKENIPEWNCSLRSKKKKWECMSTGMQTLNMHIKTYQHHTHLSISWSIFLYKDLFAWLQKTPGIKWRKHHPVCEENPSKQTFAISRGNGRHQKAPLQHAAFTVC